MNFNRVYPLMFITANDTNAFRAIKFLRLDRDTYIQLSSTVVLKRALMLSRDRVPVTPIRNKTELMIPCLYPLLICAIWAA